MRPLLLVGLAGVAILSSIASAPAQTSPNDPAATCNPFQLEWMQGADADDGWLDLLRRRTPRVCRNLRTRMEQRINGGPRCSEARESWGRGGLSMSSNRAALERFINETWVGCTYMRAAAQRRLASLSNPQ